MTDPATRPNSEGVIRDLQTRVGILERRLAKFSDSDGLGVADAAGRVECGTVLDGNLELTSGSGAFGLSLSWECGAFLTKGVSIIDHNLGQALRVTNPGFYSSVATVALTISQDVDGPGANGQASLKMGNKNVDVAPWSVEYSALGDETVVYLKLHTGRWPLSSGDLVSVEIDGSVLSGGAGSTFISAIAEDCFLDTGWERSYLQPMLCTCGAGPS